MKLLYYVHNNLTHRNDYSSGVSATKWFDLRIISRQNESRDTIDNDIPFFSRFFHSSLQKISFLRWGASGENNVDAAFFRLRLCALSLSLISCRYIFVHLCLLPFESLPSSRIWHGYEYPKTNKDKMLEGRGGTKRNGDRKLGGIKKLQRCIFRCASAKQENFELEFCFIFYYFFILLCVIRC